MYLQYKQMKITEKNPSMVIFMNFYSVFIILTAIIITHKMKHKTTLDLEIRQKIRYTFKRQTHIT